MDISKYKLGDYIKDLKCPKCKKKGEIRIAGIYHRQEKSHELECSCFYTEKANPKQVEFTYVDPDDKKKKKER